MKRIDLWRKKLELNHRLIINSKKGWVRIIRILGGQFRFETVDGEDLLFNTIEEVLKYIENLL